jgi:hypothetical protein
MPKFVQSEGSYASEIHSSDERPLANQESLTQGVIGINQELMATCDMSSALYLWNDSIVRAKRGRSDDTAGEAAANDTLDNHGFSEANLPLCVMDGQSAAQTRPRR